MPQKKLSATQVTDILYLYAKYGTRLNFSVLARHLTVSPVTVHAIAHRKIRQDIPSPSKKHRLPAVYQTIPNLIRSRIESPHTMTAERRRELAEKVEHNEWLTDLERAVFVTRHGLNGDPPKSVTDIAAQMNFSYQKVGKALYLAFKKVDGDWSPPRHHLLNEKKIELLKKIGQCKLLTERERYALIARYGLDEQPPKTLEDIGRTLSVTREWVRKIIAQALGKVDSQ